MGDLFDMDPEVPPPASRDRPAPLADRMRPRSIADLLGQQTVGTGSLLSELLEARSLPSLLLWGPPGCGKTTLAHLLAERTGLHFAPFSAVLAGVKELRQVIEEARQRRARGGAATLLFIDEIHHFNRSQQDALLPHVEDGTVTLIGATTENPSFHVNAALLSRCTTLAFQPLDGVALQAIAERALTDREHGLGEQGIRLDEAAMEALVSGSHGDARALLNRLESLVVAAARRGKNRAVGADEAARLLQVKRPAYDKRGEQHYDLISALHKSIRGGDPQAALYWLVRMLDAGEEPLYLCRRLVRMAAEDIGLADPGALRVALDATETFRFLGSPEGDLALAEAAVYLATAPKSNAVYAAFNAVRDDLRKGAVHPVPVHLRNAPTTLMKQLGFGAGYQYPHDLPNAVADQAYLPRPLEDREWYAPSPFGHEKEIGRRMAWWAETRRKLLAEKPPGPPAGSEGHD